MSKVYPSNLTLDQYEFLNNLLPDAKPGGRPRELELGSIADSMVPLS